jgi:hypothetical protein
MTQLTNMYDIPENIQKPLIRELEYAWGKGTEREAKTVEEAKRKVQEMTGYSLEMLWQNRYAKLNPDLVPILVWISQNLMKEGLVYSTDKHADKFPNEDHKQLCREAINNLWNLYVATPDTGLPLPPVKPSFFKRLFK